MQNFINGKYVPAQNYLDSYDPSTGDVWAKIPDSDESEVETAVEAASKAFERYIYICMFMCQRTFIRSKVKLELILYVP